MNKFLLALLALTLVACEKESSLQHISKDHEKRISQLELNQLKYKNNLRAGINFDKCKKPSDYKTFGWKEYYEVSSCMELVMLERKVFDFKYD